MSIKHLSLSLVATLAMAASLSACSSDEDMAQNSSSSPNVKERSEIAFKTNTATRGGETVDDLTSFRVCCSEPGTYAGRFFKEKDFTWDSVDQTYRCADKYYWPTTGNLNFWAFSPASWFYDPTYTNTEFSWQIDNFDGVDDLVVAVAIGETKPAKATPLTFKHILSQVLVDAKAKDSNSGFTYRLKAVRLKAADTGSYHMGMTTGSAGSWRNIESHGQYAFLGYSYAEAIGTGIDITGSQTAASVATALASLRWNIIPSDNLTFDVEYQVLQNGRIIKDFTGSNKKTVVDNAPALEMGKRYVYMLNLSDGLNPEDEIKFTKTITDYVAGDGKSLNV